MITTSDRAVFVGGHVRASVKDALKAWSKEHKASMSSFMAEAIEQRLLAEGVVIQEDPINVGEPLPFEEPSEDAHA